jgi:hypothetical protein
MREAIAKHFDIPSVVSELRTQKWFGTEPYRIDRTLWIGSYELIRSLTRQAVPTREWYEAAREGMEDGLVDDYLNTLAVMVGEAMGEEHVYGMFEDSEAFLGQYEDMSAAELREMGFEIGRY